MKDNSFDIAIVGAGIVGLGHAAAALERSLKVVVVERATSITGATVRNFGHVGVEAHAGEAGEYARRSREIWLRLAERAGFWARRAGTLVVARHEDELAVLHEAGVGEIVGAEDVSERAPVRGAVGGSVLHDDLQVDPREAAPAIAAYLAAQGVEFRWRTSALGAENGVLHTSRGELRAQTIVFAVGHDVDQVFPHIAEAHGIERCGLDMMLADGVGLQIPVLTGSSMLRYSSFASAPSTADVRARYERDAPSIFEYDVNQMYTERPDGTLLVGDTHTVGTAIEPFQDEAAFELLSRLGTEIFGMPLKFRQRWQGVYAKGPGEFLCESVSDGVRAVSVTTGAGMTCGLGLSESVIDDLWR